MQSVLEAQYYLANKSNIPISESNELPIFERELFVNLLMNDMKKQQEAYSK